MKSCSTAVPAVWGQSPEVSIALILLLAWRALHFLYKLNKITTLQQKKNTNIWKEKIFKSKKIHKTTSQLYMDGRDGIYKKNNILFDLIWMYNLISVVFIFLLEKKISIFLSFSFVRKENLNPIKFILYIFIGRKIGKHANL